MLTFSLGACATDTDSNSPNIFASSFGSKAVKQSKNDESKYHYFKLLNGLSVLLVSDEEAQKSSASLVVTTGSFDDPNEIPGLSHFLEHMLFLGTKKYPVVNEFPQYISQHGGIWNAYTSRDHTNYFFDIHTNNTYGALDRFAQFFVAPLLSKDFIDRERNAVHAEYKLQLRSDLWRDYAVFKTLVNPEHPLSKFNIGNIETLSKPEINDQMHQYLTNYYNARDMHLVIVSSIELHKLQEWVEELFAEIPNRSAPSPKEKFPKIFTPSTYNKHLVYKPIHKRETLNFIFSLPDTLPHYKIKPLTYLALLLGQEGTGSLHSYLKDMGWIDTLNVSNNRIDSSNATLSVTVTLTTKGKTRVKEIGNAIFYYIELLKNTKEHPRLYEEIHNISELEFDWSDKQSAITRARSIARNMQYYKPNDILAAPYLFTNFDLNTIKEYLSYLQPANVLLTQSSPDAKTNQVEKWFGVEYSSEKINKKYLKAWNTPSKVKSLHIQMPNPFLPQNLDLLSGSLTTQPKEFDSPDQLIKLWIAQDGRFKSPKSNLRLFFENKKLDWSAHDRLYLDFYLEALRNAINSETYSAIQAGIMFDITSELDGFSIGISGYTDKQVLLLSKILKSVNDIAISKSNFNDIKEKIEKELINAKKQKPYKASIQALSMLILEDKHSTSTLHAALPDITKNKLVKWRKSFFEDIGIQGLVHGNVTNKQIKHIYQGIKAHFPHSKPWKFEKNNVSVLQRPVDTSAWEVHSTYDDSAMLFYVQGRNGTYQEQLNFMLLDRIISSPYFHNLRTLKQLGYVVTARYSQHHKMPGISFIVQSPTVSANELVILSLDFIGNLFHQKVHNMTRDEFLVHKTSLLRELKKKPESLTEQTSFYINNINLNNHQFNRRQLLAETLESMSIESFRRFYDMFKELTLQRRIVIYHKGKFIDEDYRRLGTPVRTESTFKTNRI